MVIITPIFASEVVGLRYRSTQSTNLRTQGMIPAPQENLGIYLFGIALYQRQ